MRLDVRAAASLIQAPLATVKTSQVVLSKYIRQQSWLFPQQHDCLSSNLRLCIIDACIIMLTLYLKLNAAATPYCVEHNSGLDEAVVIS